MAEYLSDSKVIATISIESPCDKRVSARDLRRIESELEKAEAIIALTCGSGVQAISEITRKMVIAALDTCFLGMVERLGIFYERCSQCGECILNDTAEICPVTLCPKGIMNGPCEGIIGERCESNEERECVWHTIYTRLEERDQLDNFTKYHEPIDWRKRVLPREEIQR